MKKLIALMLSAVLLTGISQAIVPTRAADTVTEVSTAAELTAALENNAGAHVRLAKDIVYTTKNAADNDFGVILGEGHYTVDLNGFKIEYNYTGRSGNTKGVPLATHHAGELTINGPGSVVGGEYAVEQANQFGVLTVNGGTLKGVINSGIRMTGGIAYINGGTVTGNFYGVFHEDGIVVLNGGTVKSVHYRNMGHPQQKYGVIKNGVFTGNAILEDIILIADDLTVSDGSTLKVTRGGGLIVKNSFISNGTFTYESGLKSINGEALISKDFQVSIAQDVTFGTLNIKEHGRLRITNGATVTVSGAFSTEQGCSVVAEDGMLRLLGSIDHRGRSEGVPELAALEGSGGPGMGPRDFTSGVSATEFGIGTATCQMYLTFVLRALGYSDAGGVDFTWDKPESLALSVGIMPEGVHAENFLRADMVLISEAALSARLKDSRDTLLDRLIADGAVRSIHTD